MRRARAVSRQLDCARPHRGLPLSCRLLLLLLGRGRGYTRTANHLPVPATRPMSVAQRVSSSMATVTPLRRASLESHDNLAQVRALAQALAPADGHITVRNPDLCFYRFAEPTQVAKTATFGVTFGVVLQGEKQVRIGEHTVQAGAGQIVVITRETEIQSSLRGSASEPYLGVSCCFEAERVARALVELAEAGESGGSETIPAFVMPIDAPIADALLRLLRTLGDELDRKLIAPLVIDELLYRLLRSDAAAAMRHAVARPNDAHSILASMQYIREHHARKLSVEALARIAGMSPSHYAHRFRAVARMSPMRYVREARLERARALLFEHGARASFVAAQVGFESPAHFAREFKRRFGAPPSQLMRANR